MKYLLAHRYKKIGAVLAPIGLLIWACMQLGLVSQLLINIFGEAPESSYTLTYHTANVCIAVLSFFSFLTGIYFITFSKEKIEDEMVERTRLESFQFAALIQLACIIIGFLYILFIGESKDAGLMTFFIGILFLFWLSFISRFHFKLHYNFKHEE